MLVYIAAPYSSDPDGNIDKVLDVAEQLVERGYGVLIPHLNHLWHERRPKSYEYWMKQDVVLLSRCEAVYLGLWDESPGRDREEVLATKLGKQVFREFPPPLPVPAWQHLYEPPAGSPDAA